MFKIMASSRLLSLANLFILAIAFHLVSVNGMFSDNMYIGWGAHHSWMQGNDLQLVLDQSSGKVSFTFLMFKHVAYVATVKLSHYDL